MVLDAEDSADEVEDAVEDVVAAVAALEVALLDPTKAVLLPLKIRSKKNNSTASHGSSSHYYLSKA